jgi:hypothetical protein
METAMFVLVQAIAFNAMERTTANNAPVDMLQLMELVLLVIIHAKHAHRQRLALLANLPNSELSTLQHPNANAILDISTTATQGNVFHVN